MSIRIAVVGGGWYGAHIASTLLDLGFETKLFEKENRLLNKASGNNQFRLHQGFHYARSAITRIQSREGFSRFVERYPTLSAPVDKNIYAIPKLDSIIDFETYKGIMFATGISFDLGTTELPDGLTLTGIDGTFLTRERVILLERSRKYFNDKLISILNLNYLVETVENTENNVKINGEVFDYMIDATWGHFSRTLIDVFYEPTLLLYYDGPRDFPALTFVDGPLCSLYPTEDPGLYTLSSVPFTPLGKCGSVDDAQHIIRTTSHSNIDERKKLMEQQISKYFPDFQNLFKYLGPQLSMKTKPVGASDDRGCYVHRTGRIFSVLSGKIDTIFFATDRILSLIASDDTGDFREISSSIRQEVNRPFNF